MRYLKLFIMYFSRGTILVRRQRKRPNDRAPRAFSRSRRTSTPRQDPTRCEFSGNLMKRYTPSRSDISEYKCQVSRESCRVDRYRGSQRRPAFPSPTQALSPVRMPDLDSTRICDRERLLGSPRGCFALQSDDPTGMSLASGSVSTRQVDAQFAAEVSSALISYCFHRPRSQWISPATATDSEAPGLATA
jgi:hypothetical protein